MVLQDLQQELSVMIKLKQFEALNPLTIVWIFFASLNFSQKLEIIAFLPLAKLFKLKTL